MSFDEQFGSDTDEMKREIEQSYDADDDTVAGAEEVEAGTPDSPLCIIDG